MLPTTTQMKSCDKLDEIKDLEIKHIEKQLEQSINGNLQVLQQTKIQIVYWKSHISKIIKERYATLSVLKKLKTYTIFHVW